jgi:hypothetical protein
MTVFTPLSSEKKPFYDRVDTMRSILFASLVSFALFAQVPPGMEGGKVAVQNSILAKVDKTTISMMDVKKKLDLFFHQNYPQLATSPQARLQFYETSWRSALLQMIDNELILADAKDKEIKLTDGEVREELESRFGPNVLSTLDKIGVTYDEAWKMIRNDIIVQRMSWWFIQSKALQAVAPQDIRQAYKNYLVKHPSYTELKYRVVSVRSENPESAAAAIHEFLIHQTASPDSLLSKLQEIDPTVQVSAEYTAKDTEISDSHKASLSPLSPGHYSAPVVQKGRAEGKTIARIFYLQEKSEHPAKSFDEVSPDLRNELVQQAMAKESTTYLDKLRKHYGFDNAALKESFPEDMHPFSLQ